MARNLTIEPENMAKNGNSSPELPSRVFVDADAFVAAANKKDPNHKKALRLGKLLAQAKVVKLTSDFAFGEAVTVVSQKVGHIQAVRMGYDIQGGATIVDSTQIHREKALEKFSKQTTKNARFTDMVNMVLMDELKIDTIFSFDEHYPKSGYKLLSV